VRLRFSLVTVFAVFTYLCVMAALAGIVRYWLLAGGPVEKLPSFVAIKLLVGGGFVLMSSGVGGYFVRRLTRVYRSRSWPRTTAIVLPTPERRHPLQEKGRGETSGRSAARNILKTCPRWCGGCLLIVLPSRLTLIFTGWGNSVTVPVPPFLL
jgi:hypothetical protein